MTPNPASVEQLVMERRLSVLSGSELAPMIQQSQVVRKNSDRDRRSNDRSPRSKNGSRNESKRKTSVINSSSPQVVKVPINVFYIINCANILNLLRVTRIMFFPYSTQPEGFFFQYSTLGAF